MTKNDKKPQIKKLSLKKQIVTQMMDERRLTPSKAAPGEITIIDYPSSYTDNGGSCCAIC